VVILTLLFIHLLKKEDAMSISALRSARCIFSVMAVTVFSAVVLVGCGKDDDGPSLDGKLICADGEGWLIEDDGSVFILKGDGSLVLAIPATSVDWGNKYNEFGKGTWSTNGNNITTTFTFVDGIKTEDGRTTISSTGTYTVSSDGKTLTMTADGGNQTCTKISGIIVQPIPKG
jgi:hypothetical protein